MYILTPGRFRCRLASVDDVQQIARMTVTLKPALEEFVRGKVEAGEFRSADEVVGEALPLLQQQEENWTGEARRKIDEGWARAKSGQLRTADQIRANLAARKQVLTGERGGT